MRQMHDLEMRNKKIKNNRNTTHTAFFDFLYYFSSTSTEFIEERSTVVILAPEFLKRTIKNYLVIEIFFV